MTTTHESLTPLPREASLPAVPSRHAAPRPLSRRVLRKVLNRVLGLPSQLEAFLVDFYPEIYSRTALGMDREAKLNLLLSLVSEAQLTQTLQQEYPQETAQVELRSGLLSSSLSDERRTRYTVVLLATISDMDVHKVYALLNHLRRYTADSELTIEEVRSGSVVLACAGSEHGFIRLYTDYRVGHLSELLGYRVKEVKLGYGESLRSVIAHLEPPGLQRLFHDEAQAQAQAKELAERLGGANAGLISHALSSRPLAATPRYRSGFAPTLRPMTHPGLVTEALRGDKKRVTAELKVKPGHPWRQVLWLLGPAACVAIVALLGEGRYKSESLLLRSSLPGPEHGSAARSSAPSGSESEPASPDQPEARDRAPESPSSFQKVAVESAPSLLKSAPGPLALGPARRESPPPSKGRSRRRVVVVRCADSGPCPRGVTQSVVRSCLGRYLPGAGAGRLALQRVGATYAAAHRPRGAGEAALVALIGCVQSGVAELYGPDSTVWPTELRLTLSGPPSGLSSEPPSRSVAPGGTSGGASGDTSGDASGDRR